MIVFMSKIQRDIKPIGLDVLEPSNTMPVFLGPRGVHEATSLGSLAELWKVVLLARVQIHRTFDLEQGVQV